jgi:hypothetical protein
MKTYTVHIESIEHYNIEVLAHNEEDAEEKAWQMFPHKSAEYGENNVTEVTCNEHKETA